MAAFDPTTGALQAGEPGDRHSLLPVLLPGATVEIAVIDLAPVGQTLYLTGRFSRVNGAVRLESAAVEIP